jgi:hypothetical protein
VHAAISRAVQRNIASGFDDSFRRHLVVEQRRAVLDTIARELTPDTTLGDIVDAAQDLGWADGLGELCLADLALALFGETPASAPSPELADADETRADAEDDDDDELAADDSDDDDEGDDDDESDEEEAEEEDEEAAPSRARKEAERKPSSLDRALDRIDKALAARRKVRAKKVAKAAPAKKAASKKVAAKKPAPPAKKPVPPAKKPSKAAPVIEDDEDEDDDTEAMSLDQAAKLLVPLVRKLREATMQDLEEQTKMGRRKLRFHIGQLVKHGRLRRHGMGRGTCYTVK